MLYISTIYHKIIIIGHLFVADRSGFYALGRGENSG